MATAIARGLGRLAERLVPLLGSFRHQAVLVTGASSGIGRQTALSFAQRGAWVALAARRRDVLEEVAGEVSAAGGRALVLPTDVADRRAVRAAVARVQKAWGRLDIVVNNAGLLIPAPIGELEARDLEAMLRVNVMGALFVMQAAVPVMRVQGRGTIINVASLAGRRGVTPLGGYCATKFALVGLTEALRTEVDRSRLHVGLVLPGVVDTPMVQGMDQDNSLPTGLPPSTCPPSGWSSPSCLPSGSGCARSPCPPGPPPWRSWAPLPRG